MIRILLAAFLMLPCSLFAQTIAFEQDSNRTATYDEAIAFYSSLAEKYEACTLTTHGITDSGKPLHLFLMSKEKQFSPEQARRDDQFIILLNNGIHPGEPEGIDASMMLARDMLVKDNLPDNTVICIIPVYNIDGMLNRGVSRVNQDGPEAYGFRGNARNLDLNRDFIKSDSRNSRSFQAIFHLWNPHVFMDTHTSNGADYQYIMTLIDTQVDKLHPALQTSAAQLTDELYLRMGKSGYDMVPYVSFRGRTPETGIVSFLEGPRYSTGYAALHHTIGYMPETHMWKPYHQRVASTYTLLDHFITASSERATTIKADQKAAKTGSKNQKDFVLSWQLDTTQSKTISFKGYESGTKTSDVSGLTRLYYDRSQPYTREVTHYNRYKPALKVAIPAAYVIPQAWREAIDLLELNGIETQQLEKDTVLSLNMYYITDYQTARTPYEGHYLHSQVQTRTESQQLQCYAGDYIIWTNQPGNRYIVETLEPQAPDSFFNWNFFDTILSQKEYFSDYIFEDEAAELLAKDPSLKTALDEAKSLDENLRNSARAQLDWIYRRSPYYEKSHLRYPVGRMESRKVE